MHHFDYRRDALHAEGVPLERIAREVGTPTYVYSTATLKRHFQVLEEAFASREHLVCYSVKACSNLSLLRLLAKEGSGFDIVSGGELFRALEAGAPADRCVYSGVGKTEAELTYALDSGILLFNVESEEELTQLERVARRRNRVAAVALRVNPSIDAKTHPHISTALRESKFGIPLDRAASIYRAGAKRRWLRFRGVDCHIGSQITQVDPLRKAVSKVAGLYRTLLGEGLPLEYLDIGGGLGITYVVERPPSPADYAKAVLDAAGDVPAKLIVEPGRVLVGNAAVLLTRVLYRKSAGKRSFVIVDAAMNDLMRPALYDAVHQILPVKPRKGRKATVDVVGPVCESTDVLGRDRSLPPLEPGDLLAVMSAGAYGMSMASNYNSRPRPAEVLADDRAFTVIRARESYEDLVRNERAALGETKKALRRSRR